MIDFTSTVVRKADDLQCRIYQKEKLIFSAYLIREKEFDKCCDALLNIQIAVAACIQTGNYRRACRYLVMADMFLERLGRYERQIVDRLTERIVS